MKCCVAYATSTTWCENQWNAVNAFETETTARNAAAALIAGDQEICVLKPEPDSPAGAPDA